MPRLFSVLTLMLAWSGAFAEIAPAAAPAEQGNTMGFILFGLLFVLMCVGFVWLVVWNDKKQKAKDAEK